MFEMLVFKYLYNLADEGVEYQVRDRLSFMRFLRLQLEDRVPDVKTLWLFREQLKGPVRLARRYAALSTRRMHRKN